MLRLSHKISAFIVCLFCCLLISAQGLAMPHTIYIHFFFDSTDEAPPDADVIAEVTFTDVEIGSHFLTATANIVKVIKTSDASIRQGEKIPVKNALTGCTVKKGDSYFTYGGSCSHEFSHKPGDKGIIFAKVGADMEERLVLGPYSNEAKEKRFLLSYSNSKEAEEVRINPPNVGECDPSEIEAARQIKLAAEDGDAKAQTALGLMYKEGRNTRQDTAEAIKWFRSAGESGDAEALYQLGEEYKRGRNGIEAVRFFKLAAAQGHGEAMYQVGILFKYSGYGVEKSEAEAEKWFKRAAEKGHRRAQDILKAQQEVDSLKLAARRGDIKAANKVGRIYSHGGNGVSTDHEESARWYRISAEKGDAEGQAGLARLYEFLDNYSEAMKWYKLAAAQGDRESMYRIGWMYEYGHDVEQSDAEAMKWYRLALDNGYAYILSNLVNVYNKGRVVVEDDAEVVKWYRLSAEGGYNVAQFGLGRMYQMGDKVKQNDAEAIMWFLLAAAQRNQDAPNAIAEMERQGRGVAANYEEVAQLLELAARKGNYSAKRVLDSLEKPNSSMDN
ncbi:hypothetical protein LJB99_00320 [Deltaproteobacteria bacterium OttesenSCG-928-K17]|nr:hypothetical protein [Deltaproteobacteria bacterium OttesenSCG-928-K17]